MRVGHTRSWWRACAALAALLTAFALCSKLVVGEPKVPATYLVFDGTASYAEIPSSPSLSLSARGLTVAVWMRPDALTFPKTEGSLSSQQYVHWLEKGQKGAYEWTFRMYSLTDPGPRQNRVSFYVFNPQGARGCGSYFQDPLRAGEWMQVVGVADQASQQTAIYKNGVLRHKDSYATLAPAPGAAPLRLGSGDLASFFKGAIGPIVVWNRPLSAAEIATLYQTGVAPQDGLVARYAMDEAAGTILRDSAGHADGRTVATVWGSGGGSIGAATGHSGGGC